MIRGISVFSHGNTSYFDNISVRTNFISNSANRLPIFENNILKIVYKYITIKQYGKHIYRGVFRNVLWGGHKQKV